MRSHQAGVRFFSFSTDGESLPAAALSASAAQDVETKGTTGSATTGAVGSQQGNHCSASEHQYHQCNLHRCSTANCIPDLIAVLLSCEATALELIDHLSPAATLATFTSSCYAPFCHREFCNISRLHASRMGCHAAALVRFPAHSGVSHLPSVVSLALSARLALLSTAFTAAMAGGSGSPLYTLQPRWYL